MVRSTRMHGCPRCDATGDTIEVRVEERIHRCRSCALVFDPRRVGPRLEPEASASRALTTSGAPIPHGFERIGEARLPSAVYRDQAPKGSEVEILFRWRETTLFSPSLEEVKAWPIGLIVFGFIAAFVFRGHRGGEIVAMMAFLTIGGAYGLAALVYNVTRLSLGGGELRVEHGPLPWVGNRRLPATAIDQIFCVLRPGGKHSAETFEVHAAVDGHRRAVKLVSGLASPSQALYIEVELEKALGIQDHPVVGELPYKRLD